MPLMQIFLLNTISRLKRIKKLITGVSIPYFASKSNSFSKKHCIYCGIFRISLGSDVPAVRAASRQNIET